MPTITKKQKNVFDFVSNYVSANGLPPTTSEIKTGLGLKSDSTIHEHLGNLKRKGYLTKTNNLARSISLKREFITFPEISIMGNITAGQPLEAIEYDAGSVRIP